MKLKKTHYKKGSLANVSGPEIQPGVVLKLWVFFSCSNVGQNGM